MPCFECDTGHLVRQLCNYTVDHPKLGKVIIPDVPLLTCDSCGDRVLGDEGNQLIEAWMDSALDVITPNEIQTFLSKYRLTQKQASRITGLGEKNISRWASGHSRPSESVSNFLRLLLADSDAFERLRQKNFRAVPYPAVEQSPSTKEREVLLAVNYRKLAQLGFVIQTLKPSERRTQLCRWGKCADLLEFRRAMSKQAYVWRKPRTMGKEGKSKPTGQTPAARTRSPHLKHRRRKSHPV